MSEQNNNKGNNTRPLKRDIANMGFSGMQRFVMYFNFSCD